MKVVLNQDVKGLGKKLQIVEVSEGYARNFLFPKKLAVVADNKNVSEANNKNASIAFRKKTEYEAAVEIKEKLEKSFIEFRHKVGEGSKLFGSVTEKEIADEANKKFNTNISKKKVIIKTPIKSLGTYTVNVKLYEGVIADLKVVVTRL